MVTVQLFIALRRFKGSSFCLIGALKLQSLGLPTVRKKEGLIEYYILLSFWENLEGVKVK